VIASLAGISCAHPIWSNAATINGSELVRMLRCESASWPSLAPAAGHDRDIPIVPVAIFAGGREPLHGLDVQAAPSQVGKAARVTARFAAVCADFSEGTVRPVSEDAGIDLDKLRNLARRMGTIARHYVR
jgi:hypothetical protein